MGEWQWSRRTPRTDVVRRSADASSSACWVSAQLGIVAGSPASNAINEVAAKDPTGLAQLLPAGGGFRYYSIAGPVKRVTPAEYVLSVGGLVDQPVTLSYADLAAMPQTQLTRDFQCVTGWRVPECTGAGVLLRDVLDRVGRRPAATALHFTSFDGAVHRVPHLGAGTA